MADVLDFTGRSATQPGEPVPEVVDLLEQLLVAARGGQILAIAFATVEPGGFVNDGYAWGKDPIAGSIMGAVAMLQLDVVKKLKGPDW